MRLPRNISGADLIARLAGFGYEVTRQRGSHVRLTTQEGGEHHLTVPNHNALRVGTLSGILSAVGDHLGIPREEVAERLFGDRP